jgi:hypothetical protein
MPKRSRAKEKSRGGTLRIGDQWNAINIIARSQTHPLKAVCELTENAIDAKAKVVQIVRRRSQGALYLEVVDDGQGVPPDATGEPDFVRIATHVCDSMKRHLDGQGRAGVHGEFGIGLLSFWSVGETLRIICQGRQGLYEMELVRGKPNYAVRPVRGTLPLSGTRVIVGPLLSSTAKVVTGEKLARYLSNELRDRIRSSGVQIQVIDRVARKTLAVRPREFEGQPLDLPSRVGTEFGDVIIELYYRDGQNSDSSVAVCKDGTRVLRDITELMELQHDPWTSGRLEGVVDFAAMELAPGTRSGIVPDEKLLAFVNAIEALEAMIMLAIEQREKAETDKASRDILRQVHRAFVTALRDLSASDYLFFDLPEPKTSPGKGSARGNGEDGGEDGLAIQPSASSSHERSSPREAGPEPVLLSFDPGPLASVHITPRHVRRRPGDACELRASAYDEQRVGIPSGVDFSWQIVEGIGTIENESERARIRSDVVGQLTVRVTARQAEVTVEDQVIVKFLEHAAGGNDESSKGLPSYRLEAEHGKPWRSRYAAKENEIIINSAHRDFLFSRTTVAKHRRYVGKLYAKELVLINFPHEAPAEVMERLIEITLRTEDSL